MDSSLKQRLVGAVVLIALAVIFLPMLVKGPAPDSGVSDVPLGIPGEPKAADTTTRDLPLIEPGTAPKGGAVGMPEATPESANPGPAQDGQFAAAAAGDYAVSFGSYASAADADKVIAALRSAELPAYREAVQLAGRDAQRVRIGPFTDHAMAEAARLRAAQVNDGVGAKVVVLDAGMPEVAPAAAAIAAPAVAVAKPGSPAMAEPPAPAPVAAAKPPAPAPAPVAAAKPPAPAPAPVAAAKPPAPALASKPAAASPPPAAPATPAPVAKPVDTSKTGFAVQVGAFAAAADATALRDKLRSAGFNAFTESVRTDKGTLTRVRVGPAMTRAEAEQLKSSVQAKLGIAGIVRPHP
ncbi:MAG TPA: SPOR domain-containing protein [Thermomonas sp.]|nr:SPOR domain-containing protein [Thermomonas sp.]